MEPVVFVTILVLFIIVALSIAFLWYRIRSLNAEKKQLSKSLAANEQTRAKLEQQLNTVLSLTHDFTEAKDEDQIIETLVSKAMELSGAIGGSFVPLDDNGHPKASVRQGSFPFPVPDAWLEYLATPEVRDQCQRCAARESFDKACPLLHGPFSEAIGLYCFPLRYSDRELGVLNIYMPGLKRLDAYTQGFIHSIAEATALALEGDRLRRRELLALSQMDHVRHRQDLETATTAVLENLQKALNADFSLLVLDVTEDFPLANLLKTKKAFGSGDFCEQSTFRIEQTLKRLKMDFTQPIFTNIEESQTISYSWLGIPVPYRNQANRSWLLVMSRQQTPFSQRRIFIAQSVAEKLALLLQNVDSLAGIEYKILMEERTRLAREIHDGLAQTLGFLKLQIAQMIGYMEREDVERLREVMRTCYDILSTAYQDARLAIDGLRISPYTEGSYNLKNWLAQTAEDYSDQSFGIKIEVDYDEVRYELPPEYHAQLIRIVQEALSNIRKHAQASSVWITCTQKNRDFILEIRDDGVGFTPDDIPKPSRYGLRGMRERSELLGADFQVISRPGQGTTIRVRIPVEEQDWMEV